MSVQIPNILEMGFAGSDYLLLQKLDCGSAVSTNSQKIDGGRA